MHNKIPKYTLQENGEFVIENYNYAKPFANFFPGIAGAFGIPIWVFYVNRGQAISSFGSKDKDHSILEFWPANKAWQKTSLLGYRTFLKVSSKNKEVFYEPFHNGASSIHFNLTNRMKISSYGLVLQEENTTLGLAIRVEYFTIPNDNYGGLARIVTLKNTSKQPKKIQIIDGLPQIVPFCTNNWCLKKMSRTIEAWMTVLNLKNNAPFYKLAVDPADRPEVVHIKEGNFYLAFHFEKNKAKLIKPIIDPQTVFGPISDFSYPLAFVAQKKFRPAVNEVKESKTPSAFMPADFTLTAKSEKSFYSLAGYMLNEETLNASLRRITKPGYFKNKNEDNQKIISRLQENVATESSCRELDLYTKQTYLDNLLRGGYPVTFKSNFHTTIFYLYSRKHGDMERDYNKFHIQPAYFSQGNGNYRDVNQNRRCDGWFNPDIKDENVIAFYNLLQADGFNPLVIRGTTFSVADLAAFKNILDKLVSSEGFEKITKFLQKPFTPGDIALFIEEDKIKLNIPVSEFLNILLSQCNKNQEAEHGEGFWSDHWTYNLDLLENYLGLYPENLHELIFHKKVFTYFDNVETVRPRRLKYILYHGRPRQLNAVAADTAKKELIAKRQEQPHIVRTQYGIGQVYHTTLLNKLLCLAANKMASLDPFGVGIEMEANKPNWYDALNGLPALFGSSLCETFELKRMLLFLKNILSESAPENFTVTDEVLELLSGLNALLEEGGENPFNFWDASHTLREEYLHKTKLGFSGNESEIKPQIILLFLENFLKKLDIGIKNALDKKKNIYYAYFINEVTDYELIDANIIKPLKFTQKTLPYFLGAQVHALKTASALEEAKALYAATKKSELFDKKLKMYRVNANLDTMPEEIGRCRIFPKGWLENQSIWLHMEYKYLLEILRAGLYEEFFKEFKNVLVPFQNPQVYGRNILENSSFIVSSAFADKNLQGNGFVARLSGSTAEYLSIWLLMNTGKKLFFLNEKNELNLKFSPLLPGWLFSKKDNTYSFNFLGKTKVTYHNYKKKDTFGKNAVSPKNIVLTDLTGKKIHIDSDTIPSPHAVEIRSGQFKQIDIHLE